ncbi:unnamed protein product [Protopolystoma xenopodis]|uniref:Uncharacterized protein n=1 Tax=Protopolystoma xenopodis TaxID=117903 RepID=A0A448WC82_9PLAT|nr:unnamed protein product [Protopolystoma xenopodis]
MNNNHFGGKGRHHQEQQRHSAFDGHTSGFSCGGREGLGPSDVGGDAAGCGGGGGVGGYRGHDSAVAHLIGGTAFHSVGHSVAHAGGHGGHGVGGGHSDAMDATFVWKLSKLGRIGSSRLRFDDDFADRLNYQFTGVLMFLFIGLIGIRQYVAIKHALLS